jgi:hypothetical protein
MVESGGRMVESGGRIADRGWTAPSQLKSSRSRHEVDFLPHLPIRSYAGNAIMKAVIVGAGTGRANCSYIPAARH